MRLVTFSGGSGHFSLLKGLKELPGVEISAVVAMTDNGKSTGVLREELGMLPPGDIRRCLGALATKELMLAETLELRFTKGFLKGHTFGNLWLAALTEKLGSFEAAVDYLHTLLAVQGQVLPCTLDNAQLLAELADGTALVGEEQIDVTEITDRSPIARLWVEPAATANPRALAAAQQADFLIFGPGDFYTSVLPTVVVSGMAEAIQASQGKKVMVCNRTQKPGETHNMNALDLVKELEKYTGTKIDVVVANNTQTHNGTLADTELAEEQLMAHGVKVVKADLVDEKDGNRLDGKKMAQALRTLWN